jgi:hypothetical protein
MNVTVGHGHVFLTDADEAAHTDDDRGGLAIVIKQHVLDLADLVVAQVVDGLLVPIRDSPGFGRDAGHHRRRRRLVGFLVVGVRPGCCDREK